MSVAKLAIVHAYNIMCVFHVIEKSTELFGGGFRTSN